MSNIPKTEHKRESRSSWCEVGNLSTSDKCESHCYVRADIENENPKIKK